MAMDGGGALNKIEGGTSDDMLSQCPETYIDDSLQFSLDHAYNEKSLAQPQTIDLYCAWPPGSWHTKLKSLLFIGHMLIIKLRLTFHLTYFPSYLPLSRSSSHCCIAFPPLRRFSKKPGALISSSESST